MEDRWSVLDKRFRDLGIYFLGIAGTINELWFVDDPRWGVLMFLAGMLGFPIALAADERRRQSDDKR